MVASCDINKEVIAVESIPAYCRLLAQGDIQPLSTKETGKIKTDYSPDGPALRE
jgi:hypothetical protein